MNHDTDLLEERNRPFFIALRCFDRLYARAEQGSISFKDCSNVAALMADVLKPPASSPR